jgi:hypothetical protein
MKESLFAVPKNAFMLASLTVSSPMQRMVGSQQLDTVWWVEELMVIADRRLL